MKKVSTKKRVYGLKRNLLDADTRLFIELVTILSYPQGEAFQIAFPDTKAKGGSLAAMACKLYKSRTCQDYAELLYHLLTNGLIEPKQKY